MKASTLLSVCLLLSIVSTVHAKQSLIVISNLEKMVAIKAVDDVKVAKGLRRLGNSLLPNLESKLQASKEYQLVDRKNFTALLKEVDFNDSGLVADQVAKKFELQGAAVMMIVEFLDVEYIANKREFELTNTTEEHIVLDASVSVKVLNTSTGVVEFALPVIAVNLIEQNNQVRVGDQVIANRIWSKAGTELSKKIIKSLSSAGRPAKVLAVNGSQVLVNKGSLAGFEKDVKVKFYAMEKIVDEDSGEVFINEVPVGSGKVIRGDSRKCFVEVDENLGIAKGCVVRGV
ncbi:MAG: hypothetical protein KAG98_00670 [Lentisphaeria bacterium]|nr:hypothetical protein [Lentisphaeria bacterium]